MAEQLQQRRKLEAHVEHQEGKRKISISPHAVFLGFLFHSTTGFCFIATTISFSISAHKTRILPQMCIFINQVTQYALDKLRFKNLVQGLF